MKFLDVLLVFVVPVVAWAMFGLTFGLNPFATIPASMLLGWVLGAALATKR